LEFDINLVEEAICNWKSLNRLLLHSAVTSEAMKQRTWQVPCDYRILIASGL